MVEFGLDDVSAIRLICIRKCALWLSSDKNKFCWMEIQWFTKKLNEIRSYLLLAFQKMYCKGETEY